MGKDVNTILTKSYWKDRVPKDSLVAEMERVFIRLDRGQYQNLTTKKDKVDIIKDHQKYIVEVSQQDTFEGIAQWSNLGKYEKQVY